MQTEETPNPNSLKFIPGREVMGEQPPLSFKKGDDCKTSPLAERLLQINGLQDVFFGSDFITLSKQDSEDWFVLKPLILGTLMEAFVNGLPIHQTFEASSTSAVVSDDPLVVQICELLETRIRPAVAQDGGDITFEGFEEGVVYLRMKGACSGCPSSSATLKSGIENMLKYYVPEVLEVRQVSD
nr:NifU family protein [Candidatus Finniella inopinata]